MTRFLTILVLVMLVLAPAAMAQNEYVWTISSTAVDPLVNSGLPTGGIVTLYLWLYCASLGNGVAAAEFNISGPAGAVLAFTPMNGFLNAGGATNLLLATACNVGPVVAGNWVCLSFPGEFCLVPSGNGKNVSVDCVGFQEWTNRTVGFANGVPPVCVESNSCESFSTQAGSWGEIKGLYR